MNRDYVSGVKEGITFFVGKEVEKTPAYNMTTLFVTGIQDADEIVSNATAYNCTHIYLGANQSFDPKGVPETHAEWNELVLTLLKDKNNFWVTLDFDSMYTVWIHEYGVCEYRRFIPQISVKIPHLTLFNYNATIKIDDIGFDATNPGVWVHPVRALLSEDKFTNWDQYGKDVVIK
jgi:hypothetical protein